jgi:hypothetical protein
MSQILSIGLFVVCVLMLVTHFIDIKNSGKHDGQ